MPTIKFSHPFAKLVAAPDKKAMLLQVLEVEMEQLSEYFINFDTDRGLYKLPKKGKMLMLLFLGNNGVFPTLRNMWPPNKAAYYRANVGRVFDIEITGVIERKPEQVNLFAE